jgi:hypothetical protein
MGERPPTVQRTPERSPTRTTGRDLLREVAELTARLERLTGEQERQHGAALNIRLHDREREQERDRGLGVTDCNGNGSGLQSTKIWDQIICIYPSLQDGIICN